MVALPMLVLEPGPAGEGLSVLDASRALLDAAERQETQADLGVDLVQAARRYGRAEGLREALDMVGRLTVSDPLRSPENAL